MDNFIFLDNLVIKKLCALYIPFFALIHSPAYAMPDVSEEHHAIFKASGFKYANGAWRGKYSFGHISLIKDFNGDGQPDAIIKDGGTRCDAHTEVNFHLVTKQANNKCTGILNSSSESVFLKKIVRHGWPDLAISNSNQCHQILSWDDTQFAKIFRSLKESHVFF